MTQEDINEVMANSLKSYQLENLVSDGGNIESAKRLICLLQAENAQLKSQLTWRDVSEKPEEGRVLIIENGRVLAVTYEMDDGAYYFLDDDGFECYPSKWLPIPKE